MPAGSTGAQADDLDLVDRAIQALPEEMREAILLHSSEGKDWREIAVLMRQSEEDVRRLYARALNRLALLLEELRRDARGG